MRAKATWAVVCAIAIANGTPAMAIDQTIPRRESLRPATRDECAVIAAAARDMPETRGFPHFDWRLSFSDVAFGASWGFPVGTDVPPIGLQGCRAISSNGFPALHSPWTRRFPTTCWDTKGAWFSVPRFSTAHGPIADHATVAIVTPDCQQDFWIVSLHRTADGGWSRDSAIVSVESVVVD